MTPTEKFAQDHGITVANVKQLRILINRRSRECVNAVSGNSHWTIPVEHDELNHLKDVEAHANAWQADQERTEARLDKLARGLGFDGVRYDTHVATLVKGSQELHVPQS